MRAPCHRARVAAPSPRDPGCLPCQSSPLCRRPFRPIGTPPRGGSHAVGKAARCRAVPRFRVRQPTGAPMSDPTANDVLDPAEIALTEAPPGHGVILCECFARDGLQHESAILPAEAKIAMIER